jgi:aldose 1-epimerase
MIEDFGTGPKGEAVKAVTLTAGDLTVRVLTWGAILQSVRLAGVGHDLTLGSDQLSDYLGDLKYHGSLIGPVVNRLTDARAQIGGKWHQFEVNFNGRHCLHSGASGCQMQNWQILHAEGQSCTFGLTLTDGLGGFPGTRQLRVRFDVTAPASLTMTVSAETDAETILNFANHSYWNLDGSRQWSGHRLQIAADAFLPNDADFKPTGEIRSVEGTEMDFRSPRHPKPGSPDLDTCFVLSKAPAALRDVLWLTGASGTSMTVATTEAGVQVYDQRGAARPERDRYEGLAIEAQGWPDAPTHGHFPSITVRPGEPLTQVTQWRFTR